MARLERELGHLLDLCEEQRVRCERAMKAQANDYPDPKLVTMVGALGRIHTDVMHEYRQLQKQRADSRDALTEAQAFQTLIDAGWRPPRGWAPPQGVVLR